MHTHTYICMLHIFQPLLSNLRVWDSDIYLAKHYYHCLMLIGRDGRSSTRCHSCGHACQHKIKI